MGGRLAYLDGWRGLAILCVLLSHFVVHDWGLGVLGVELFFVLSGRLMALMLLERRTPLSTFFVHRASRILPALIFYVVCAALFMVVSGHGGFSAPQWFALVTFTINYQAIAGDAPDLLLQLWSLCVEEYAYLALAVICAVGARDIRRAGWIALVVALVAMANGLRLFPTAAGDPMVEVYWRSDVRIASIALSFAAACLYKPSSFWPFMLGGCALFLAAPLPLQFTVGTFGLSLAINGIDAARWRKIFEVRWLCLLGAISYSLYLWQHPFYNLGLGLFGLLAAVIISIESYRLIEVPARSLINERWRRRAERRSAALARAET